MATPTDIAESLTLEEIPIKLRCATCNKLAQDAPVNAEDCRPNKALRQTVKIFLKKKVIDKENARKKELLEKAAAAAPATPATPMPEVAHAAQQSEATTKHPATIEQNETSRTATVVPTTAENAEAIGASSVPTDAPRDIPQQSIESPGPQGTPRRDSTQTLENGSTVQERADGNKLNTVQQQQQQQQQGNMMGQNAVNGMNVGFGFDGSNGPIPNMAFNGMGDINQMMQFLPNGMPNPMMAGFPNMMGMPGMGMDPMAMSQGMYNGFGGPGMISGMNMGMGFDAGQGAFGGPQAWNAGQDKFNQNVFAGGMAGNNFGPNAGYGGYNVPPHQGSFNQMHHQPQYPQNNDFHQHGYHNQGFQRGRGRGRGGYPHAGRGRGYYNQVGNHANNAAFHQQVPQGPVRRGSPQYTPMNQQDSDKTETLPKDEPLKDEFAPGDAEDRAEEEAASKSQEENNENPVIPVEAAKDEDSKAAEALLSPQPTSESVPTEQETKPAPIQTFISGEISEPKVHDAQDAPTAPPIVAPTAMPPPPSPLVPTGPSSTNSNEASRITSPQSHAAGRGFLRGASESRGGLHGRGFTRIPNREMTHAPPVPVAEKPFVPPAEPKGQGVAGAPTGPKALRQEMSNTGVKDTGFSIVGRASAVRTNGEVKGKSPTSARSRSRSHSPSRHQSSRHRHHRHRSTSPGKESEDERRRERHRRHSRKYENGYEEQEYKKSKSSHTREPSIESSTKRSSHRRHRDREYEKEKDKESSRSTHRSHRSHRDRDNEDGHKTSRKRSRSPSLERDIKINGASRVNGGKPHKSPNQYAKEVEQPSSSSSRKRRTRDTNDFEDDNEDPETTDRDRHHNRRRKRSKHDYPDGATNNDLNTDENNIRPSTNHDRPTAKTPAPIIPTGPKLDTHAQEREARNRERQMKELQRRAIMGSGANGGGRRGSVELNGVR
ncbi:MAG: hypothetical protein Q9164_005356, partial [Protoblastenia rupestris]